MKAKIIYNGDNGVTYRDILMEEDDNCVLGKYGHLRHEYIKAYSRDFYQTLIATDSLDDHLCETDKAAQELFNQEFVSYCMDKRIGNEMRSKSLQEYESALFDATNHAHGIVMRKLINT